MDSLRGGPATAQIRVGIAPIPVQHPRFPLDCDQFVRERIPDSAERVGGQIPGRAGCVHFAEGVWERTGGRSGEADCNAGSAALSLIPSPSTIV